MSTLVPEIVVFRPEPKASLLVHALQSHNISAVAIEPFTIHFISFEMPTTEYSDIIFTSTYAVEAFFSVYFNDNSIVSRANVWAVGGSTAQALLARGIKAYHPDKADSEHLYAMFSHINHPLSNRHFLLVKGMSGRELLTERLQQQAASLSVIECYERKPCDKKDLLRQLEQIDWCTMRPKVLLYTSFDALKATMSIFDIFSDWQQGCTITVTNRRMLDWAKRQGFAKLCLLENLTHDQLVAQIIKLR